MAAGGLALDAGARRRVAKTGGHVALVTTEGSARQHGRGIAQAMTAARARGRRDRRRGTHVPRRRDARVPARAPRRRSRTTRRATSATRSRRRQGHVRSRPLERHGEASLGDDDRPRALHRLLGVRHGVLRREQHSDGRRAAGRAPLRPFRADRWDTARREHHSGREMAWMRLERYFEGGEDGKFGGLRDALRADDVPALRQRAVRAGVPGVRDVPRAGRPERAGLQPLRRHALLLEQLPVQGSLLQLVRVRRAGSHAVRVPRAAAPGSSIPTSPCAARASWRSARSACSASARPRTAPRLEDRELAADEFTTACAQACPSRAITFGDAADENWSVAQGRRMTGAPITCSRSSTPSPRWST